MKQCFSAFILIAIVWTADLAAKGPQVEMIDNRLSINAEAISLGRLLRLVDLATGMQSTVPPDLANRNISVRFSDLTVTEGVRKVFEGQPLDYVMIQGQGIIVTAASQTISGNDNLPPSPAVFNPPQPMQPVDQPFTQDFATPPGIPIQQQIQQQPAMVQTPFGPMANPRAQQQAQPNVLMTMPGQQNSLFPQPGQNLNNPQQPVQIVPGGFPNPTPFGTPSPFGTANPQVNQNNGVFVSPPVFSTPGAPPR